MANEKILIVDDEPHIVELVRFNLEKEGYRVIAAYDGNTALKMGEEEKPALVILDIMLPGIDGFEVCRLLQRNPLTQDIPILMLTARGEEMDKVLGLELGADDYMTKPFSPRELVARVKARLRKINRRATLQEDDVKLITFGDVVMDPQKFTVHVAGVKKELTPKEFELLKLLALNPGKVLTRDMLLEKLWGYQYMGDTRTVDVHIRHLRQKIEKDPANPEFIHTVRGIGYRFEEK